MHDMTQKTTEAINQTDQEKIPPNWKYADLLDLPCPVSKTHPKMSNEDRAAQFAPFAALVGYEDAVCESARRTSKKLQLSEEKKEELDRTIVKVRQLLEEKKDVQLEVTCFVPDEKKSGGAYVTLTGRIRRVMEIQKLLLFDDGEEVLIDDISELVLLS